MIFALVFFLQKKKKISYAVSFGAMTIFIFMILYNSFVNNQLSYEVIGLSIIVIGILANLYLQKHKQTRSLAKVNNN